MLALARPGPLAHAQEQFVLKLGSSAPIGSPWHTHLRALARHLETATGGHLRVKLLAGGSLGSDADVLPRLADGRMQAYATSTTSLGAVAPTLGILGAPYVLGGTPAARRRLDGGLDQKVASELRAAGLVFGSWSVGEQRLWLSAERPVRRPRDLRGARAGRTGGPGHDAWLEALSANPVDLPQPLGFEALGSAKVDVIDDTLLSAVATGRDRWARHVTLDDHAMAPWVIVYSGRWFDGLPEQIQQDLSKLPRSLLDEARRVMDATRAPLLQHLQARGIQVHEASKAERRAFARSARGVTVRLARELGVGARRLLSAATR